MIYKVHNDFSPVVRAPKVERISDMDVVTMSCGGGMGGAKWNEFIFPIDNYQLNGLIEVKDIFDKEEKRTKILNSAFIVKIEHKKLVAISYDKTRNPYFGHITTTYYGVDKDDTIQVISDNSHISDNEKPKEIAWTNDDNKIKIVY